MRLKISKLKSRRAFTLIEMVVVIVLISIVAAMIIPEMKGSFNDALLRSTGRDLVNVFSFASSRAVGLGQCYRVRFDAPNGRYAVERQIHDGTGTDFVPLKDVSGAEGRLVPHIAVAISAPEESSSGSDLSTAPPLKVCRTPFPFIPTARWTRRKSSCGTVTVFNYCCN